MAKLVEGSNQRRMVIIRVRGREETETRSQRSVRSEGTEWISEEGVAAGPPGEPPVDLSSLPSPDLWRKHLYSGLL